MGGPVTGDVVIVPFPFTDLSGGNRRPALVLASLDRSDHILAQITSRDHHDASVEIQADDFAEGSLPRRSYARPLRVITLHERLLRGKAGRLHPSKLQEVRTILVEKLAS